MNSYTEQAMLNDSDHAQAREVRAWSSASHKKNTSKPSDPTEKGDYIDKSDQPPEARAWSAYQAGDHEDVLDEGPIVDKHRFESPQKIGDHKSKEDQRRIERILSYIDNKRPPRHEKYRLSWRSFVGTMSGIDKLYQKRDFLKNFKRFRLILIFIDSVLRGIAQVMFANNPISGIIMMVGLFIGNWELALYAILGTTASTLTAHIFGFNYSSIRAGLFGFSGCLTAMGIAYFSFSQSPQLIPPIIIMSCFSTIFVAAVGKILVQRLGLSPYTFSFQISTWIWLLGALKYRYFFINGNILNPSLLRTALEKPSLANVSYASYSVKDNFVGFFAGVAQVFFIESPYTGAIILVAIGLCSPILSFFALFGSVTGQLTAAYILGLPAAAIHAGLWGYNSVLTCQALGGMFFVLHGYRIWLFTLFGSVMTILVQAAVSAFLTPCGMPTLTFPFTFICWIFCLTAGSKDLVAVKVTAVTTPEDHLRRYRLARLVKKQFQFLNYMTDISFNEEDVTWEELLKIQTEFMAIVICSHVKCGNLDALKKLKSHNINLDVADENSRTPLHLAACSGDIKMCKWLKNNAKPNFNAIDNFGGTPLFDALINGNFMLLPFLYSCGARLPSCKSEEIAFYMNSFVAQKDIYAIELLTACGFNPNTGDSDGRNALHTAVICNQYDVVQYLVEETQIWLDIEDYSERTPSHYANNLLDSRITEYLKSKLNTQHNPLKVSKDNLTSLRSIIEKYNENNLKKEEPKSNSSSNTNIEENILPTLFSMIAAQNDNKKMTKFLDTYSNLHPVQSMNYDGRTAAHVAAASGQLESLKFLAKYCTERGFQLMMNREDRWCNSALDEAHNHGYKNITDFYYQYISEMNVTLDINENESSEGNFEQNKPFHIFSKLKKDFIFFSLAGAGDVERLESLFKRGFFSNEQGYVDYNERTPMHFAANNGHVNTVKVLMKYYPQWATKKDRWGNCPIDEARNKEHNDIVELLSITAY